MHFRCLMRFYFWKTQKTVQTAKTGYVLFMDMVPCLGVLFISVSLVLEVIWKSENVLAGVQLLTTAKPEL